MAPSRSRVILNKQKFSLTIDRLCNQLIENHDNFSETAIIGVQPRGIFLAQRIEQRLKSLFKIKDIKIGNIDVSFYRDDFRRNDKIITPSDTNIDFSIEGQRVILVDDVLYTGRTIRAALDALLDFGRPSKVELMALIDRRFSRHLPIEADYVGKTVDAIVSERVKVEWQETDKEDKVILLTT